MATPTRMDAGLCERLIGSATSAAAKACPAPPASTADSLAAVADAIALATFALAIIVAFATLGWFIYVRHRTREEAKSEVQKVAPAQIKTYLDERLAVMVADALAALIVTAGPVSTAAIAAQEQGRVISEDAG